ncbi:hypothetical protein PoB_002694600 [Plakobranchus ocellatus]|uniref:Uncharacterized protein n=1 Tax=Plakobranchus ocellatus TaxID=259542 RepID=A0AAV3ZWY1_9GAST|nr:hypothetical protein PoB_002694600 [Plakobranchus ocellatus]
MHCGEDLSGALSGEVALKDAGAIFSYTTDTYPSTAWDVSGTVAGEFALRSEGTLLSWVRASPPTPWPDGGPESLRSPCCGLAI